MKTVTEANRDQRQGTAVCLKKYTEGRFSGYCYTEDRMTLEYAREFAEALSAETRNKRHGVRFEAATVRITIEDIG